jgi:hypothetical protein
MFAQTLFGALVATQAAKAVAKGAAVCLMGAGVLWWVADHAGPAAGTVYVHVTEPNVDVAVGGEAYHVGSDNGRPIVCELAAGSYTLRMMRGDELLYEERFTLGGGQERVLTAWRPPPLTRTGVMTGRPARAYGGVKLTRPAVSRGPGTAG